MTLPVVPNRALEPDEIDRIAVECADAILSGVTSRESGHMTLASLVYVSSIPESVAVRSYARHYESRQGAEDLANRLRTLMVNKILLDDNGDSMLDPVRLVTGSSFSGWMRNFLNVAVLSEYRNLMGEYRRTPVNSTGVLPDGAEVARSPEATVLGADFDRVTDVFLARSHGLRAQARLQLAAASLRVAYGLPATRRYLRSAERKRALEALEADPRAAWRVVDGMSRGALTGSALEKAFSAYDPSDLATLSEVDPQVAATIARATLAAHPPLPVKVATELRRRFVALSGQKGTVGLARSVVSAWLAHSTTMDGDEYNGSWALKDDEAIAHEASQFVAQATRLVRKGFHTFASPEEISAWLYTAADAIAAAQALARPRQRVDAEGSTRDTSHDSEH